jgi:hypothetical protein
MTIEPTCLARLSDPEKAAAVTADLVAQRGSPGEIVGSRDPLRGTMPTD